MQSTRVSLETHSCGGNQKSIFGDMQIFFWFAPKKERKCHYFYHKINFPQIEFIEHGFVLPFFEYFKNEHGSSPTGADWIRAGACHHKIVFGFVIGFFRLCISEFFIENFVGLLFRLRNRFDQEGKCIFDIVGGKDCYFLKVKFQSETEKRVHLQIE